MFRHILVPLDGSLRAERAIPVAARIARSSHGMMILLRVVQAAPEPEQANNAGPTLFQAAVQSELDEAQHYLTHISSSSQLADLALSAVVLQGPVVATIQTAIHSYQADLLVCSEQQEPQATQQFLGAFIEQLIKDLPIPLLLIPGQGSLPLDSSAPNAFVVVFAGSQPEPYLIQPASALLAALTEQKLGHLHFVPLRSLLSPSIGTHPAQQAAAHDDNDQLSPAHSAVLLKKSQTNTIAGESWANNQNDAFILATSLVDEAGNSLLAISKHLRLFVPQEL